MTAKISRKPLGQPTGGQFASHYRTDFDAALTIADQETVFVAIRGEYVMDRRFEDDLPPYPDSLPEPQVSLNFDDGVYTAIAAGDIIVTFWSRDGESHNSQEYAANDEFEWPDEADKDEFLEWGAAVHNIVDMETYGVTISAVAGDVEAAIVAKATGKLFTPRAGLFTADETASSAAKTSANRAISQVSAWVGEGPSNPQLPDQAIVSVLADLMHLADASGDNWDAMLKNAAAKRDAAVAAEA